jgi:hypothetical protein
MIQFSENLISSADQLITGKSIIFSIQIDFEECLTAGMRFQRMKTAVGSMGKDS